MNELINGILLLLISIVLFILSIEIDKNKHNTKTVNEQAGYINYLLEENRRLREKLYMDYDPQKFKQEWQEQEVDIPQQPTGTHGRFSG